MTENNKEGKVMSEKKLFYVNSLEDLNEYERKHNKVSYRRIFDRYVDNAVLCNNIAKLDMSVWDNAVNLFEDDEDGDGYQKDIYQYFVCNLNEFEVEELTKYGFIMSYSDELDVDVIMVDHFGTGWDYVLTDAEPTTDYKKVNED